MSANPRLRKNNLREVSPHYLKSGACRDGAYNDDADLPLQMQRIERRLQSAERNRDMLRHERYSKSSEMIDGKIMQAKMKQKDQDERRALETLKSVILKHHDK